MFLTCMCSSLQGAHTALIHSIVEESLKVRQHCGTSIAVLAIIVRRKFDYVHWQRLRVLVDEPPNIVGKVYTRHIIVDMSSMSRSVCVWLVVNHLHTLLVSTHTIYANHRGWQWSHSGHEDTLNLWVFKGENFRKSGGSVDNSQSFSHWARISK